MSFELQKREPLREGLRRIFCEQLEEALAEIAAHTKRNQSKTVHEVRKHLKRLRAVLRLIRGGIDSRLYAREQKRLREAGRKLSEIRDADVKVQTLAALSAQLSTKGNRAIFSRTRRRLQEKKRSADAGAAKALRETMGILKKARTAALPLDKVRWRNVCAGIRRIYKQGQDALDAAASDLKTPEMHEWRKRAKDLRYALELLEPLSSEVLRELAREWKTIGELLGSEHDLAVLRELIAKLDTGDERDALLVLMEARHTELQCAALDLGQRLYGEKPRAFAAKIDRYWKAAI